MKRIRQSLVERSSREYVLWAIEEMRLGTLLIDDLRTAYYEEPTVT